MKRKTQDRLELGAFIVFVVACVAMIVAVPFERGCISISEPEPKPVVLAKKKVVVVKKQTNLTLHWAAIKAERTQ